MQGIFLLFFVPLVAFTAVSVTLVGVAGAALPWLDGKGLHFVMIPWVQALVKMVLLLLVVVMPIASILTWMERKQSAMMQDRVGPNRAAIGPIRAWGIVHFLADAVKMIMKEDFVPAKANKFLFTLAPVMAIVPVFVVFAIVPFGGDVCTTHLGQVITSTTVCAPNKIMTLQVARLDVGLLFYFIPNTKMRFRHVWPGAIVTGLLWRGALSAFSWYARDLASWNKVHGSIAAVVVFMGGVEYLIRHGAEQPHYRIFRGEPADLRSIGGILQDTEQRRSTGIIQLGLVLLLATPVARVLFSVIAFALQRDRLHVVITLIVLSILLYSIVGTG